MGLASWKVEFYPIDAQDVTTWAQAIDHSLLKWKGLLPNNLAKHNVILDSAAGWFVCDRSRQRLDIDSFSCALCHLASRYKKHTAAVMCSLCPLAKIRGGNPCDKTTWRDVGKSPWAEFVNNGNPRPMIAWLQRLYDLHVAGPMIAYRHPHDDGPQLHMNAQLSDVAHNLEDAFALSVRLKAIDAFEEDEYLFDNPDHHTFFFGL